MDHRICRPGGLWINWGTGWRNPELRVDFEHDIHFATEMIGENEKDALVHALRNMADLIARTPLPEPPKD